MARLEHSYSCDNKSVLQVFLNILAQGVQIDESTRPGLIVNVGVVLCEVVVEPTLSCDHGIRTSHILRAAEVAILFELI